MVYSASTANNEPPLQSAADFLYALTFPATAETFSTTSASVATNVSTAPVAAAAAAAAGVAPALIGLPLFFRDAQRTARYAEISDYMLLWGIIDIALVIWICSGNAFTILAIACSRRLRTITSNWFVLALAMSDLLVGITLPYHLAFYMGSGLGAQHGWCLLRFFLIIIACCVSICNLIAIAVDRYVAIVYPLHYVRFVTRRVAVAVMCSGWLAGCLLGGMPMVWNNWATAAECEFDEVLPQWYVVGVMTPLFTAVWVCMLVLYVRIWAVASQQARKIARSSICALTERRPAGGDRKSVQLVLLILGCFTLCWLPYFTVASLQMFSHRERGSPTIYKATFSLAMANSGLNPMIYAWKNPGLRAAFGRMLRGQHPDHAYDQWTDDEEVAAAKRRARQRSLARLTSIGSATTTTTGAIATAAIVRAETDECTTAKCNIVVDDNVCVKASEMRASKSDLQLATLNPHRLLDILHIDSTPVLLTQGGFRGTDNQHRVTFPTSCR